MKQRKRKRNEDELEDERLEKARTYSTGGRVRSTSIGSFLNGMFLIGRLSAPELQEGSEAANANNNGDALTAKLGKTAKRGKFRGNCSRDILGKLCRTVRHRPDLYSTQIPFWCNRTDTQKMMQCLFLLPHELIEWLATRYDPNELTGFTNAYMQQLFDDWLRSANIKEDAVACGLWGDAATYNTRDSIFMILMNVLSGTHHKRLKY